MDRKIDKQVEVALESFSTDEKNDILKSFTTFKDYLADKVKMGEKMGLSDETLTKATEKVAGYLAAHEEPRNREEHLLQQLWKTADKDQQHALSQMLLKLTKHEG